MKMLERSCSADAASLLELLLAHLPQPLRILRRTVAEGWIEELLPFEAGCPSATESQRLMSLALNMKQGVERREDLMAAIDRNFAALTEAYFAETDNVRRRNVLQAYLESTVDDPRDLRADIQALYRYLDFDALRERHLYQRQDVLVAIEMAIAFVGRAAASALELSNGPELDRAALLVHEGDVLGFLSRYAENGQNWMTRLAAVDGVGRLCSCPGFPAKFIHPACLRRISNCAGDLKQHAWVQGAAMRVWASLSPSSAQPTLAQRLLSPAASRHDFLVRRQLVDALPHADLGSAERLIAQVIEGRDPSEHVRIGLPGAVRRLGSQTALYLLHPLLGLDTTRPEESHRVRIAAVRAASGAVLDALGGRRPLDAVLGQVIDFFLALFERETHALPLTTACDELRRLFPQLASGDQPQLAETAAKRLLPGLLRLSHAPACPPAVHECAAAAAEVAGCIVDSRRQHLTTMLSVALNGLPSGEVRRIPLASLGLSSAFTADERELLGRAMADMARLDLGLLASRDGASLLVQRGDRFERRLWRILHEVRSPASNKRQAFRHTVGRVIRGSLRAPPGRLAELTATTVPGERVFVGSEGGWGRHLPTVDDFLNLPWNGSPVEIYSSYGVTTITPPAGWLEHLKARGAIWLRYQSLSALRTSSLGGAEAWDRRRFVDEMRRSHKMGVRFARFAQGGGASPVSEQVSALFGGETAAVPTSQSLLSTSQSAMSVAPFSLLTTLHANGQLALALFLAGSLALFLGRAHLKRRRMAAARGRIPFSIGGWGTRGKSGSERLKAALFHGLGYETFVKTTGCEAMFIHSVPETRPVETFIFRPYDKASIWEHRDMLELAAALKSDVFLWECMALNPEFANMLQNDWTRDDLVTLTNAYPDHEDIQGPAGVNVAESIASFIPEGRTLITSEENFLPLFAERCRQRRTKLVPVAAGDAELLAHDLLSLFPYEEHPSNIALIARLAEEIGIDAHLAIATMAEHVVPDLGVLKTYPAVRVHGREMRFVNGMSANERTGFLSNWQRTGCAEIGPERFLVTVVNNRADRVARSEVFSRILVEDAVADAHLLIGTNLKGLLAYIEASLARFLAGLEVVVPDDLRDHAGRASCLPVRRLARHLARLRLFEPEAAPMQMRLAAQFARAGFAVLPSYADELSCTLGSLFSPSDEAPLALKDVRAEVRARLAGLEHALHSVETASSLPEVCVAASVADVFDHAVHQISRATLHARLRVRLKALFSSGFAKAPDIDGYHALFVKAYRELFMDRIIVVDNPTESGDSIIDRCARAVPPGTQLTVLGIQNIKGTGLDFVYRWIALDQTMARLDALERADAAERSKLLRELETFDDYGLVDAGVAAWRLARWPTQKLDAEERARFDATRQQVAKIHEERLAGVARAGKTSSSTGVLSACRMWIEPLLGMRFRFRADRVIRDLAARRISHSRAARMMRAILHHHKVGA